MSSATQEIEPQLEQGRKSLRERIMTGITRNVLVLGMVSFFTDVSSEMIVPVRILFLVLVLRTPLPIAGLIEGVAESTASLLKIVAGRMSDRVSRRKPLILFGYGVSNAAKPLLSVVANWPSALGLIFLDRVGKGVRGSPRDAMMADSTPKQYMGKAFGFHRSMDTLGAAVGPLLTYVILLFTSGDIRSVFAWTAIPGALSVVVILVFLRERKAKEEIGSPEALTPNPQPLTATKPRASVPASALGVRFWMFTAISTIFALGNSSDAFIFLRTAGLESSVLYVPLLYFWLYVERAYLHGVISGYTTDPPCSAGIPCFLPGNDVTRGQTAKIVANAFFPDCYTPGTSNSQPLGANNPQSLIPDPYAE